MTLVNNKLIIILVNWWLSHGLFFVILLYLAPLLVLVIAQRACAWVFFSGSLTEELSGRPLGPNVALLV